ncbi:MAG TPA: DUF6350 family protein [Candidatus Nanopelagicaceae bacterium]
MFQRVLWVSLTQALRSIALVLLPTAFIAMLGWATAGSSNGNTSDPMRAALWLWLGAHHVPFNLVLPPANQAGFLSYLPLGAMVFPIIAIRSCFMRAKSRIEPNTQSLRLLRITFSILYAGFAALLAWGSSTHAVSPVLYYVPITTIPIVWIATVNLRAAEGKKYFASMDTALRLVAIALGISALVLGISLAFHISTIQNLIVVLQPGLLGGVLLFIFNLLYLPNAIVATLAYLVGPGFAIGAHTLVAPLTHRILEIPALPLLGALPTGRHPLVLLSGIAVFVAGIVLYRRTISAGARSLLISFLALASLVATVSYLSSGALLTSAMGSVGVSIWQVTLAIALELGIGIFFAWAVPAAVGSISRRRAT